MVRFYMKATFVSIRKQLDPKLTEIARRLGKIRTEIWQRYGGLQNIGLNHPRLHRRIRNRWLADNYTDNWH